MRLHDGATLRAPFNAMAPTALWSGPALPRLVPPRAEARSEQHPCGAWTVTLHRSAASDQAPEAWRIVPALRFGRRTVHALALFDGAHGGGRGPAQAAAVNLEAAAHAAMGIDQILEHLEPAVRTGGGHTGALVVFLDPKDPGAGACAQLGDSAAYTLAGRLRRITPRPARPEPVLGEDGAAATVLPFRLRPEGHLLLCTADVEAALGPDRLARLLGAPPGAVGAEVDLLLDDLRPGAALLMARREG